MKPADKAYGCFQQALLPESESLRFHIDILAFNRNNKKWLNPNLIYGINIWGRSIKKQLSD